MEALSEDIIRGVVRGQGVNFAARPSQAAGERKEVGYSVELPFYVLGGYAAPVVESLMGDFASDHEVCFAGTLTGPEFGRVV